MMAGRKAVQETNHSIALTAQKSPEHYTRKASRQQATVAQREAWRMSRNLAFPAQDKSRNLCYNGQVTDRE